MKALIKDTKNKHKRQKFLKELPKLSCIIQNDTQKKLFLSFKYYYIHKSKLDLKKKKNK